MFAYLNLEEKRIVVIGGGVEGYRKTVSFLNPNSKILVISETFSEQIKKLHASGKVNLRQAHIENAKIFLENLEPKPDLLVAATNNRVLNAQLIEYAKAVGCIVYAPDNPSISDFILPAVAKVGDVRVAISTSGKSPLMASVLRRRIEKLITKEDLLQIELQSHIRKMLKKQALDQKARKKFLSKLLCDEKIQNYLKNGELAEAKKLAIQIFELSRSKRRIGDMKK